MAGTALLRANGGVGGSAGKGVAYGILQAVDGVSGAGGGGGRIATYSGSAIQNVTPSNGTAANGTTAGTPTVSAVTATMTNTDPAFVPVNAWLLGPDACQNTPGCYQQYTVTVTPSTTLGLITFGLKSSAINGYATNACFSFNCVPDAANDPTDAALDTAPDCLFEGAPCKHQGSPR